MGSAKSAENIFRGERVRKVGNPCSIAIRGVPLRAAHNHTVFCCGDAAFHKPYFPTQLTSIGVARGAISPQFLENIVILCFFKGVFPNKIMLFD